MCFELGLEKPNPKRALTSILTIGLSYLAGGLIPVTLSMSISSENSAFDSPLFYACGTAYLWICQSRLTASISKGAADHTDR